MVRYFILRECVYYSVCQTCLPLLRHAASSSGNTEPEPQNGTIHHAANAEDQGNEDQSDGDQSDEDQSDEDGRASHDGESEGATSTSFWASLPCMDSNRVERQSKHGTTLNKNNTDSVPNVPPQNVPPQDHNQNRSSARDKDLRSSFFEAGFNQNPEQKAFNLLKGRLGSMKLVRIQK